MSSALRGRNIRARSTLLRPHGSGLPTKLQLCDHFEAARRFGVSQTVQMILNVTEQDARRDAIEVSIGSTWFAKRVCDENHRARSVRWNAAPTEISLDPTVFAALHELMDGSSERPLPLDATEEEEDILPATDSDLHHEILQMTYRMLHAQQALSAVRVNAATSVVMHDPDNSTAYTLSSNASDVLRSVVFVLKQTSDMLRAEYFSLDLNDVTAVGEDDDYESVHANVMLKVAVRRELMLLMKQTAFELLKTIISWNSAVDISQFHSQDDVRLLSLYYASDLWRFLSWTQIELLTDTVWAGHDIAATDASRESMITQQSSSGTSSPVPLDVSMISAVDNDEDDALGVNMTEEELAGSLIDMGDVSDPSSISVVGSESFAVGDQQKYAMFDMKKQKQTASSMNRITMGLRKALPWAREQVHRWGVNGYAHVQCRRSSTTADSGSFSPVDHSKTLLSSLKLDCKDHPLQHLVRCLTMPVCSSTSHLAQSLPMSAAHLLQRDFAVVNAALTMWQAQWQTLAFSYEDTLRVWHRDLSSGTPQPPQFVKMHMQQMRTTDMLESESADVDDSSSADGFEADRVTGGADSDAVMDDALTAAGTPSLRSSSADASAPRSLNLEDYISENPTRLHDDVVVDERQRKTEQLAPGVWRTAGSNAFVWTVQISWDDLGEWLKRVEDYNESRLYVFHANLYIDLKTPFNVRGLADDLTKPLYFVTFGGKPSGIRMKYFDPTKDYRNTLIRIEDDDGYLSLVGDGGYSVPLTDLTPRSNAIPTYTVDQFLQFTEFYPLMRFEETSMPTVFRWYYPVFGFPNDIIDDLTTHANGHTSHAQNTPLRAGFASIADGIYDDELHNNLLPDSPFSPVGGVGSNKGTPSAQRDSFGGGDTSFNDASLHDLDQLLDTVNLPNFIMSDRDAHVSSTNASAAHESHGHASHNTSLLDSQTRDVTTPKKRMSYHCLLGLESLMCAALAQSGFFDARDMKFTQTKAPGGTLSRDMIDEGDLQLERVAERTVASSVPCQFGPISMLNNVQMQAVIQALTHRWVPKNVAELFRELQQLLESANRRLSSRSQQLGHEPHVRWFRTRQQAADGREDWVVYPHIMLGLRSVDYNPVYSIPAVMQPCLKRERLRCNRRMVSGKNATSANQGVLTPVLYKYFQTLRRMSKLIIDWNTKNDTGVETAGLGDEYGHYYSTTIQELEQQLSAALRRCSAVVSSTTDASSFSYSSSEYAQYVHDEQAHACLTDGLVLAGLHTVFDRDGYSRPSMFQARQQLQRANLDFSELMLLAVRLRDFGTLEVEC